MENISCFFLFTLVDVLKYYFKLLQLERPSLSTKRPGLSRCILTTIIETTLQQPTTHNGQSILPHGGRKENEFCNIFCPLFFVTGQGSPSQEEWEERILHLSMDVLSECMLGIRLSGHSFLQWRFEVLKEEK